MAVVDKKSNGFQRQRVKWLSKTKSKMTVKDKDTVKYKEANCCPRLRVKLVSNTMSRTTVNDK